MWLSTINSKENKESISLLQKKIEGTFFNSMKFNEVLIFRKLKIIINKSFSYTKLKKCDDGDI